MSHTALLLPFSQSIAQSFCQGSAIAPSLFGAAIRIVEDTGLWEPNFALGQEVRTQWQTRKPHGYGAIALFVQESGDYWQGKPQYPRSFGGKIAKYEAVAGIGNAAYLPPIPLEIRQAIAARWRVDVPSDGSFWQWLAEHPEVPIALTEGGKKALCLLSHGYVAIAVFGCQCLKSSDLIPFLPGRQVVVALDSDTKPTAIAAVQQGLRAGVPHLEDHGATVRVATWDSARGKGVDDLVAAHGIAAFDAAWNAAQPYQIRPREIAQAKAKRQLERLFTRTGMTLSLPNLSAIAPESLPSSGIVAISSPKGTGKTKLLAAAVAGNRKVLALTPRRSLARNLAERLGLLFHNDIDTAFYKGQKFWIDARTRQSIPDDRLYRRSLCFDSLLAIDPEEWRGCELVLDEVDQGAMHLLIGATCGKEGKRAALLARFAKLVSVAKRIILSSADLGNREITFTEALHGSQAWILHNTYQGNGYPVRFLEAGDDSAIVADIIAAAHAGDRFLVMIDSLRSARAIERMLRPIVGDRAILAINSKTSGGDIQQEFLRTPDAFLEAHPGIRIVLATPSMGTGVSIEGDRFERVYGLFYAGSVADWDASQMLSRYRPPVPRVVWARLRGPARGFNALQLRAEHYDRARFTARQLGGAEGKAIAAIAFTSPANILATEYEAAADWSRGNFRDALLVRLQHEGNAVAIVEPQGQKEARLAIKAAKKAIDFEDATAIALAEALDPDTAKYLEKKDALTPIEQSQLERFQIAQFDALKAVTLEMALDDRRGRRRRGIAGLERSLFRELALDRDRATVRCSIQWEQPIIMQDLTHSELQRRTLELIGFFDFLKYAIEGGEWQHGEGIAKAVADRVRGHIFPEATARLKAFEARKANGETLRQSERSELAALRAEVKANREEIAKGLGFTISPKMYDTQIIGEILSRFALKTKRTQRTIGEKRVSIYRLDREVWESVKATLLRRHQQRLRQGFQFTLTPLIKLIYGEGVQATFEEQNVPIADGDRGVPPPRPDPNPGNAGEG